MKKFLKIKRTLIVLIVMASLLIWVILGINLLNKDKKEDKQLKENTYTMFVKINPLVKLTFNESYYTCNGKKCSNSKTNVIDVQLVNETAKETFNEIDLKEKDILNSIYLLVETYLNDSDKQLEKITVITDWENYKEYKLQQKLEKFITKAVVNYDRTINEEEILEKYIKRYKVTFDCNGGEKIEDQVIEENQKIKQPENIKKDGYTFLEWQFNGKKYDFDSKVIEDITLKAVWKKKEDKTISNKKEPTNNKTNTSQTNNQTENNTESTNNEQVDPEAGCYVTPEKNVALAYKFPCGMEGKAAYDEMLKLKAGELKQKLNAVNDGSGHAQQLVAGYNLITAKYNYKYDIGIAVDIILIDPVDKVSSFGYLKEDGTVDWVYFREAR